MRSGTDMRVTVAVEPLEFANGNARAPQDWVGIPAAMEDQLIRAAQDTRPVEGLTHRHYRYPARFSPLLVSKAIEAFTDPGDLVGDPFVGGGTSVVEALAARRRAFGTDISSLATFVSQAKTLLPSEASLAELTRLLPTMAASINMTTEEPRFEAWTDAGYFRNMTSPARWRLRKAISQAIAAIQGVGDEKLEMLARCVLLRTAQWALDGRKTLPTLKEFRHALIDSARIVADGATELLQRAGDRSTSPIILNRSAAALEQDAQIRALGVPKLVIMSPPYPGVHVLYHRWQVDGRKETPAPFFIANALDGSGAAYYTMGDRKTVGLRTYFEQLEAILRSTAAICDSETTLVQVVAFAQPEWQLTAYLATAERAGWTEVGLRSLQREGDGRLWRVVPNRKWYAEQRGHTNGAREAVLFHRLA